MFYSEMYHLIRNINQFEIEVKNVFSILIFKSENPDNFHSMLKVLSNFYKTN